MGNVGITDRGAAALVESVRVCPGLELLDLGGNFKITDATAPLTDILQQHKQTDVLALARRPGACRGQVHRAPQKRGDSVSLRSIPHPLLLQNCESGMCAS
jgi:hypothetical protein